MLSKGECAFYDNELIQVWIIYYFQVIGEAVEKRYSHEKCY